MTNHLRQVFKALLFLFAVAFLGKVAFALYHHAMFTGVSAGGTAYALLWGARFELALAAALTLLAYLAAYLLFRLARLPLATVLRYITFVAAAAIVILHGSDALYFSEVGRHLGYELKEGLNSRGALLGLATGHYALPVALYLLALVPLWFVARWLFGTPAPVTTLTGWRRLTPELQLVAAVLVGAILVRGGFQTVPLEPLHAQQIGDSGEAALALDGAYNAVFSSVTPYAIAPVLDRLPTPQQLALVQQIAAADLPSGRSPVAPQPNVVVVLLESWSAAYMHAYGYGPDSTPFFDELRSKSFTTRAMLAGGHRTTEGLFASMCSAQNPLGQTVAQTQLQNYDYQCLPRVLKERGYYTAFFQGTHKNTSGTGAFAQLLGFSDSYGVEDATTTRYEKNSWGLQDPDLYDLVLARIKQVKKPVFIGINSNSTHDSELPRGVTPLLPPGTRTDDYVNVLHFADGALRDFVTRLYADPETANTLLVLVADHAGLPAATPYESYLIPFLLYRPGIRPVTLPIIAAQRDVAPTLLDALGLPVPRWYMGHSLFSAATQPHLADYYAEGELGWVEGDRLVTTAVLGGAVDHCYSIETLLHPTEQQCGGKDTAMLQRAMAFTTTAQHLLFSGRLRDFGTVAPTATDESDYQHAR